MNEMLRRFLLGLLLTAGVSQGYAQTIYLSPQQFGAVCDGGSHPLSGVYGSLAAAQAVYPFAVSLTQQLDYVALQKTSNTAFGAPGSENGNTAPTANIPIYIPQGKCWLGNDTWRIANLNGSRIIGAGTNATQLAGNGIVLQFDGMWYTELSFLSILSSAVSAGFTGSISGTTLTVNSAGLTGNLAVGQSVNVQIAQITAVTGGNTYTVTPSQTLTSTQLTAQTSGGVLNASFSGSISGTTLTVSNLNGQLGVGSLIFNNVASLVSLTSNGVGGAGAYTIWPSQTVSSTTMTANTPDALDIDGNTGMGSPPNSANATLRVQGDNLFGLLVSGGNARYAVAVCRQGQSGGQCSEMSWVNFHGLSAIEAVYFQVGSNALDNAFFGGDMQSYPMNGAELQGGGVKFYGFSFESTQGYTQVLNNGCDISANQGGQFDSIIFDGGRSESLVIYCGAFSQWGRITGVAQAVAAYINWSGSTSLSLNTVTKQVATDNNIYVYRVTTAGTTHAGTTPPVWPPSGTVTDGSVVWTQTNITTITLAEGWFDAATSHIDNALNVISGSVPGVTGCGTSPTVGSGSTRWSGSVTEGTGATGCIIGLHNWFQAKPKCVVTPASGVALNSFSTSLDSGGNWVLTLSNPTGTPTYAWSCWE